jgi:hypothetical protein
MGYPLCCRTRRPDAGHAILWRRLLQEIIGDRHPALFELRIHLYRNLPPECPGPGERQAGILWSLPLKSLVLSRSLAP